MFVVVVCEERHPRRLDLRRLAVVPRELRARLSREPHRRSAERGRCRALGRSAAPLPHARAEDRGGGAKRRLQFVWFEHDGGRRSRRSRRHRGQRCARGGGGDRRRFHAQLREQPRRECRQGRARRHSRPALHRRTARPGRNQPLVEPPDRQTRSPVRVRERLARQQSGDGARSRRLSHHALVGRRRRRPLRPRRRRRDAGLRHDRDSHAICRRPDAGAVVGGVREPAGHGARRSHRPLCPGRRLRRRAPRGARHGASVRCRLAARSICRPLSRTQRRLERRGLRA